MLLFSLLLLFIFSLVTFIKRCKLKKKWLNFLTFISLVFVLTACSSTNQTVDPNKTDTSVQQSTSEEKAKATNNHLKNSATVQEDPNRKETLDTLANKKFEGTQTITINDNIPMFSKEDLAIENGGWEKYGELDTLNRATSAEAMLNQSIMPTKKRGRISNVKPSGWKNKKIKGGYLYNRSHLIGHALAGEDDNWQNLITGTSQLNNPEMLRHEMDVKHYLDQSSDHYVRYSVTPVYRGDELVARGVQMQALSIGDDTIQFNIYIFNIQDGVTINYKDGSSKINAPTQGNVHQATQETSKNTIDGSQTDEKQSVFITPSGSKYHTHPHGKGNFISATLKEAKEKGLEPCKICY